MKKRTVIAIALLLLFSTITLQKIEISKFNIKEIKIENNFILKENEIKKLLIPLYEKNLFFLSNAEIENALMQNSFIESFNIKKKYPQILRIKIFEKKPIAIVFYKKKNYYLSKKIELIEFTKLPKYEDLPYVIGDYKKFKELFVTLEKLNFPLNTVKRFALYESNRWDIETKNNQIIKLPVINFEESLNNYLNMNTKSEFKKYRIFDFRINNQLILK